MTAYQVLARKWRPKNFADLVGQQHVVKALQNALDKGRLHHAYLLTGTRGVGKTTIARILAKSLNCENPTHGEPCGVCQSCRDIDAGRFVDLLEIDAASNTGIDNIREVLENAQYAPTVGKYKVYIIDEVHMLSKSAFNAMLKTLEEPPEHVKFILATTDPHKVPITVLSRCLQFVLRNMTAQQVADHLAHVLKTEQIIYEPAALALLGRAANGSMRDALSLLDQAIAMGSGSVKETDVRDMIGAVDKRYLYEILTFLMEQDGESLLAKAQEMAANAIGFDSALNDLAMLLQRLALLKTVPSAIEYDNPERERLLHLAQYFSDEQIQLYYQCVIHGKKDLPLAPDEYAGFVMTLLRMLAFAPFAAKNTPVNATIEGTQLHNPAEKKTELKTEHSGSLKSEVPENQLAETVNQVLDSLLSASDSRESKQPNDLVSPKNDAQSLSGDLKDKTISNQYVEQGNHVSDSLKSKTISHSEIETAQHVSGNKKDNADDTPPWAEPVAQTQPENVQSEESFRLPEKTVAEIASRDNTEKWAENSISGSLKAEAQQNPIPDKSMLLPNTEFELPNARFDNQFKQPENQAHEGNLLNDDAYFDEFPAFDDLPMQSSVYTESEEASNAVEMDEPQPESTPMPEFAAENWAHITHRISRQISAARMGLDNMAWVDFTDGVLHLAVLQEQTKNTLNKAYFDRIAKALSQAYQQEIRIQTRAFQTGQGWETPAMYRARIAEENREYARSIMEQDKVLQVLQHVFDAKWVDKTILLNKTK